ncbi:MAG: hypothetical protein COC15_03195 [Legionellales bacterium]|nr:MAG: hypothetical protein COC15_03195 [Legionellales bacterium]
MATYGAVKNFTYDYAVDHAAKIDVTQVTEQIKLWLQQRQRLLALYSSVANVYPGKQTTHNTVNVMERSSLCQALVDYLALGQFKVFVGIESCDNNGVTLRLLNCMNSSTNSILDFSDKYAITTKTADFRADIARLGEDLAGHLELEDKLLQAYQGQAIAA